MKTKLFLATIALTLIAAFTASPQQLPPPATNTLGTVIYTLSLRNPAVQQTNTFDFTIGDGIRTDADTTSQATLLRGLYLVAPKFKLGARVEMDTLGTGGNSLSGFSSSVEARYLSDNLFAAGIVGFRHDIINGTKKAEVGFGIGAYLTESFSVDTEVLFGVQPNSSKSALEHAVIITANYRF